MEGELDGWMDGWTEMRALCRCGAGGNREEEGRLHVLTLPVGTEAVF